MSLLLNRRSLLRGLFAAPAIVAAGNIMPVRLWMPEARTLTELIPTIYDAARETSLLFRVQGAYVTLHPHLGSAS